ncbi:MAG: hypothetical protein ACK4TB_06105 [Gemmobacter sp.]
MIGAWMIWAGVGATLAGVAGIGWCVIDVARARRAGLGDAALRARLQRAVAVNMAALGVSALGLALVVAGILLR